MKELRFLQVDVFTDRPFGGNPLAVFPDAQGVTATEMQQLALEMNLSETTFVLPPEAPGADFKVRIFAPAAELPFAGHPVVGTHWVLAHLGRVDLQEPVTRVHFELGVGVLPADLHVSNNEVTQVVMTQDRPTFHTVIEDLADLVNGLGLPVEAYPDGLQLRLVQARPGHEPSLHYWQRDGGRAGEIDFVLQCGTRIVPVELKAGAAGAMKSLHQFMFDKRLSVAVRLDTNPPSVQPMDLATTQGQPVRYTLLNLPHFLTWRIGELVDQL